jgi:hypothetical protein
MENSTWIPFFVIRITFGNDGNKALVANQWYLTSRSSLIYRRFWPVGGAIIIFQELS